MHELQHLSLEREGDVLTVRLDRAPKRNAIDMAMCLSLRELFDRLRFEAAVRLVLLRANGPVFCAGVDLKEMKANDESWGVERRHRGLDAYLAVERCPVPVIAVVHGPAFGGGCELAACADFVIASSAATFQWPEALHGGVGATQRLPRLVGSGKARELLFTARTIDAMEALRIGFVSEVVDPAGLDDAVERCARDLLRCDAQSLRGIKRAMQTGEGADRATAIDIERQAIELVMASQQKGREA